MNDPDGSHTDGGKGQNSRLQIRELGQEIQLPYGSERQILRSLRASLPVVTLAKTSYFIRPSNKTVGSQEIEDREKQCLTLESAEIMIRVSGDRDIVSLKFVFVRAS